VIRAQELAVERLKTQVPAEEQIHQRLAEVAQLKCEQEKLQREMKERKEQMRKDNEADAAKEGELRAREREFALLKQQVNEAKGKGERDAMQLRQERKRGERAIKRRRKSRGKRRRLEQRKPRRQHRQVHHSLPTNPEKAATGLTAKMTEVFLGSYPGSFIEMWRS